MDQEQIDHLQRIQRCCEALQSLPWPLGMDIDEIVATLIDFDSCHWTFVKYLSLPLYEELEALLTRSRAGAVLQQRPAITVVLPVHRASDNLLAKALASTRMQVGVEVECRISIDGRQQDHALVKELLAQMPPIPERWSAWVHVSPINRGVGMCRNQALRCISTPYFTCIDADDVFHPLRCLHALLLMADRGLQRVNTGYSRVSFRQGKAILINGSLVWTGHNSFVAQSQLLERYGYLADLRCHEDTEYMRRLEFFGVPMFNSAAVGHYMNSEPDWSYISLATPARREVHRIEGHPYLCGTVIAALTDESRNVETHYSQLYQDVISHGLSRAFPPE